MKRKSDNVTYMSMASEIPLQTLSFYVKKLKLFKPLEAKSMNGPDELRITLFMF